MCSFEGPFTPAIYAAISTAISSFGGSERVNLLRIFASVSASEMNITGTLPQAGNLKLFVPSLSTQSSTRPKQNIFNVVLMRSDKTE